MRKPFWILLAIVGLPIVGAFFYDEFRLRTDPAYAAQHEQKIMQKTRLQQAEKWNSDMGKLDAQVMSQKFVGNRLKAPSTAKFQLEPSVSHTGDGVYVVSSYVDAQNSFGSMLRMNYRCTLKNLGNDSWHLVDLKIDE
jgi:hypothetical protein